MNVYNLWVNGCFINIGRLYSYAPFDHSPCMRTVIIRILRFPIESDPPKNGIYLVLTSLMNSIMLSNILQTYFKGNRCYGHFPKWHATHR